MESKTILGIFLIILSISLPALSFGHEYVEDLTILSTLTIDATTFEVTPGSTVIINYVWEPTFSETFNIHIKGTNIDTYSPKVYLNAHQIYSGSFTVIAPGTQGSYSYTLTPYMYPEGHLPTNFQSDVKTVIITVIDSQPITHTLTVTTKDDNGSSLPNVDVSLNDGSSATTDQYGLLTMPDIEGTYTVTGTKSGYESDSKTISMTQDQSVTLTLSKLTTVCPTVYDPVCGVDGNTYSNDCFANEAGVEIDYEGECTGVTPTPTETGIPEPTEDGTIIPTPKPVTSYAVSFEFKDKDSHPIENVKVIINNYAHFTNSDGIVAFNVQKGENLEVIALKEGYNRFENSYTVNSDLNVKVQMADSGGNFFLNLNLNEYNPFYDPEGLFGVMPISVAIASLLSLIAGLYILLRRGETYK